MKPACGFAVDGMDLNLTGGQLKRLSTTSAY